MSENKLKVNVRPLGFLNLLAFKKLIPTRKKKIEEAPATRLEYTPPVNLLAKKLHPKYQYLIISEIVENTASARTFRLVADKDSGTEELAVFRPGQYLSFLFEIEGSCVTRPYSVSSSPAEAAAGFYEITVKQSEGGFVTNYIWENWQVGTKVTCSGPQGHFYYDNLRDSSKIIGIAGGSGITPFRSMAKSIVDGTLDVELTLFYGSTTIREIVFFEEFAGLEQAANGKIKLVHVLSEEKADSFEHGFITADLIRKYADPAVSSFFICGPQVMYDFVREELKAFNLRDKFIRWELFGEIKNVEKTPGYPSQIAGKSFSLSVHMGGINKTIPAAANESLLVALERANMCPPAGCRSGVCGICRSLLIKGDVFIPESEDGRRMADKQFGYIHPCSSFPISDLEIIIPRRG